MIGSTYLSIGADSMYGTNSSLGTNSSPGIGSTFEPTPSDSDSISYGCGADSGSGSRKNGIITSLIPSLMPISSIVHTSTKSRNQTRVEMELRSKLKTFQLY